MADARRRAGLTAEQIVDAALATIDEDGLAAVSMRRLGQALGVEAMTLYHYFPSKRALLDAVVDRVFAETVARVREGRWEVAAADYSDALRDGLRAHQGLAALALSRPVESAAGLDQVERMIAALTAGGLDLGSAIDLFNALSVFTAGHVLAEQAIGEPGPPEIDPRRTPLLASAVAEGVGLDDGARFAFARDALIAGVRGGAH